MQGTFVYKNGRLLNAHQDGRRLQYHRLSSCTSCNVTEQHHVTGDARRSYNSRSTKALSTPVPNTRTGISVGTINVLVAHPARRMIMLEVDQRPLRQRPSPEREPRIGRSAANRHHPPARKRRAATHPTPQWPWPKSVA